MQQPGLVIKNLLPKVIKVVGKSEWQVKRRSCNDSTYLHYSHWHAIWHQLTAVYGCILNDHQQCTESGTLRVVIKAGKSMLFICLIICYMFTSMTREKKGCWMLFIKLTMTFQKTNNQFEFLLSSIGKRWIASSRLQTDFEFVNFHCKRQLTSCSGGHKFVSLLLRI